MHLLKSMTLFEGALSNSLFFVVVLASMGAILDICWNSIGAIVEMHDSRDILRSWDISLHKYDWELQKPQLPVSSPMNVHGQTKPNQPGKYILCLRV